LTCRGRLLLCHAFPLIGWFDKYLLFAYNQNNKQPPFDGISGTRYTHYTPFRAGCLFFNSVNSSIFYNETLICHISITEAEITFEKSFTMKDKGKRTIERSNFTFLEKWCLIEVQEPG
jgi:hypothetical protein